jgi:tRNA nucleotidyltransferase (CCA-adding enzyme)
MRTPKLLRGLAEIGALGEIVPEFTTTYGCTQNKYHAFDVWEHTVLTVEGCPNDPVLRLGALFHDIGKPVTKSFHPVTGEGTFYSHEIVGADLTDNILTRLEFSEEIKQKVVHLVRHHYIRYEKSWSSTNIRRWVRKVGKENVSDLCTLARADLRAKGPAKFELDLDLIDHLESRLATLDIPDITQPVCPSKSLVINGLDIMAHLGIPPGPQVGKILAALVKEVEQDPEFNTRDQLLELCESLA